MVNSSVFDSFWMAGYECSDQLNFSGNRVDLLLSTGHIDYIYSDYRRLEAFQIKTVREGIRWSKVETSPYCYDFTPVKFMIEAAKQCHIQQIWDLCHFGFPDDLSPLHPHFTKRFVSLCRAFVTFYRSEVPDGVLVITPINEVGFISWLGGENASTSPYCKRMGWDVKYALMRAYIKGIDALREIDPGVRILTTEPLVNIVPPLNASIEELFQTQEQYQHQYQSLEMLSGEMCPELGGKPENLDILGFNYYYNNQWIAGTSQFLPWANEIPDHRWKGLSELLTTTYRKYQRPMVLSETSHPGEDRPLWINFITKECAKVIDQGIPLQGICLYPIIDRPDWDDLTIWHHAGLWDADYLNPYARILYEPYAAALIRCQSFLSGKLAAPHLHFVNLSLL